MWLRRLLAHWGAAPCPVWRWAGTGSRVGLWNNEERRPLNSSRHAVSPHALAFFPCLCPSPLPLLSGMSSPRLSRATRSAWWTTPPASSRWVPPAVRAVQLSSTRHRPSSAAGGPAKRRRGAQATPPARPLVPFAGRRRRLCAATVRCPPRLRARHPHLAGRRVQRRLGGQVRRRPAGGRGWSTHQSDRTAGRQAVSLEASPATSACCCARSARRLPSPRCLCHVPLAAGWAARGAACRTFPPAPPCSSLGCAPPGAPMTGSEQQSTGEGWQTGRKPQCTHL